MNVKLQMDDLMMIGWQFFLLWLYHCITFQYKSALKFERIFAIWLVLIFRNCNMWLQCRIAGTSLLPLYLWSNKHLFCIQKGNFIVTCEGVQLKGLMINWTASGGLLLFGLVDLLSVLVATLICAELQQGSVYIFIPSITIGISCDLLEEACWEISCNRQIYTLLEQTSDWGMERVDAGLYTTCIFSCSISGLF